MAGSKVRVFLVHPLPETASYISALFNLEGDLELVGAVADGKDAPARSAEAKADIVLVGADLPDADAAQLVRQIVSQQPRTGVIALVPSDDPELLRRFMQAGARSFLVVPFTSEQLTTTIREVNKRLQSARVVVREPKPAVVQPSVPSVNGKTIAVFGPKGGVGKTMVAANLAVALRQLRGKSTALVDGNFAMGDLHLYLNIRPDHTILDFVERGQEGDLETLQRILQRHQSGLAFLARPERPEHAEMVTAEHLRRVLDLLSQAYEYIVVDCAASYDDRTLLVLDRAEMIVLLVTPEVGSLINATIFLDLAQVLGYPRERVRIVLNRFDSQVGISVSDAESALSRPIDFRIPSRGRDLASTLNAGVPIITAQPGSEVARVIGQIAEAVIK